MNTSNEHNTSTWNPAWEIKLNNSQIEKLSVQLWHLQTVSKTFLWEQSAKKGLRVTNDRREPVDFAVQFQPVHKFQSRVFLPKVQTIYASLNVGQVVLADLSNTAIKQTIQIPRNLNLFLSKVKLDISGAERHKTSLTLHKCFSEANYSFIKSYRDR